MYLGSILVFLGFAVLSFSIIALLILIIICIFYYYVSAHEEKLLIKKYGDDYKNYMEKTTMFIPFIK